MKATVDLQKEKKTIYTTSLENLMPFIREQLKCGKSVRFSPKGKSMLPMLREDVDSVVLSPVPSELKKYDLPLYQRDNGQYVLHRIVDIDRTKETYTCVGDNQFVKECGIRRNQMIAIVTVFEHNDKKYKVTEIPYQAYCRFWHYSRRFRHLWQRTIRRICRNLFK